VREFCIENPPDKKYKRKSLIDWAQFRRSYGKRTSLIEDSNRKPFTEKAFLLWCSSKQGIEDDEAKTLWKQFKADPTVHRDNDGLGGRFQLYILKGKLLKSRTETFVQQEAEEGSNPIKKCSEADRLVLRDHVQRQQTSHADGFFVGTPGSKRSRSPGLDDDQADENRRSSGKKGKGIITSSVELTRELPKLYTSIEKSLANTKSEIHKVLTAGQLQWAELRAIEPHHINPALKMYVHCLSFKMQGLYRWGNDDTFIYKMLGDMKQEPSAAAAAVPQDAIACAVVSVADAVDVSAAPVPSLEADKDDAAEKAAGSEEDEPAEKPPAAEAAGSEGSQLAPSASAEAAAPAARAAPAAAEASASCVLSVSEAAALDPKVLGTQWHHTEPVLEHLLDYAKCCAHSRVAECSALCTLHTRTLWSFCVHVLRVLSCRVFGLRNS
jgi:hypothetical protein